MEKPRSLMRSVRCDPSILSSGEEQRIAEKKMWVGCRCPAQLAAPQVVAVSAVVVVAANLVVQGYEEPWHVCGICNATASLYWCVSGIHPTLAAVATAAQDDIVTGLVVVVAVAPQAVVAVAQAVAVAWARAVLWGWICGTYYEARQLYGLGCGSDDRPFLPARLVKRAIVQKPALGGLLKSCHSEAAQGTRKSTSPGRMVARHHVRNTIDKCIYVPSIHHDAIQIFNYAINWQSYDVL
jgi:hypothetical protein